MKRLTRLISIFLIFNLLISFVPANVFAASSDVSDWAIEAVNAYSEYNLAEPTFMNNYSSPVTREEFAMLIIKAYEKITGNKVNLPTNYSYQFSDSCSPIYKEYIQKAYQLGFIHGYGNNIFGAQDLVTREQMATMLISFLKQVYPEDSYTVDNSIHFADESIMSEWAKEYVLCAYSKGIMAGVGDGKVDPLGNTTKEQAILLIYRILILKNTLTQANQGNSNDSKPIGNADISDNVKKMSNSSGEEFEKLITNIAYAENGDTILTVKNSPNTEINTLKEGDIFYIGSNTINKMGIIGKIVSLTENSENKVLEITQPPLDEVFDKLNLNTEYHLDNNDIISSECPDGTLSIGNSIDSINLASTGDISNLALVLPKKSIKMTFDTLYDVDKNKDTKYDQVKVTGEVGMEDATIEALLDFNKSRSEPLNEIKLKSTNTLKADINVGCTFDKTLSIKSLGNTASPKNPLESIFKMDGAKSSNDKLSVDLYHVTYNIGCVDAGPGSPKVGIGVTVIATATLGITGKIDISTTIKYSCYSVNGFDYKNVNGNMQYTDFDINAKSKDNLSEKPGVDCSFKVAAEASADAGVGAKVGLILGSVIPANISSNIDLVLEGKASGEIVNLKPTGDFKVSAKLVASVTSNIGLSIKVLNKSFSYNENYELWKKVLWELSSDKYFENDIGNTSGNINNGGTVAEQGDYNFYVCRMDKDSPDYDPVNRKWCVYRVDKDGDNKKLITEEKEQIKFLNVVGKKVYYVASDFDTCTSNIVEYDSENNKKRIITSYNIMEAWLGNCRMVVYKDWIYYLHEGSLYKLSITGNKPTELVKDCTGSFSLDYKNNKIYYSGKEGMIYVLNLKDNSSEKLKVNIYAGISLVLNENGTSIFAGSNSISKINLQDDSFKSEKVSANSLIYFNVYKDTLYYVNFNGIHKVSLEDGTDVEIFSTDRQSYFEEIYVVDGWIYAIRNSHLYKMKMDGTGLVLVGE